jgi:hypothetical protein
MIAMIRLQLGVGYGWIFELKGLFRPKMRPAVKHGCGDDAMAPAGVQFTATVTGRGRLESGERRPANPPSPGRAARQPENRDIGGTAGRFWLARRRVGKGQLPFSIPGPAAGHSSFHHEKLQYRSHRR